jgi:hypothetical protein
MSTISASTTTTTAYKVAADTTGTLVLQTGATPTTAVTIDASQNVGVGVTPSASTSNYRTLQIGGSTVKYSIFGQRTGGNAETFVGWNAYGGSNTSTKGTGFYYVNTGDAATMYSQTDQHAWWIAPSGTAGNAITFTQAMTLESGGILKLNRTSNSSQASTAILQVLMSNANNTAAFENSNATPFGIDMYYSGAAPNNTSSVFYGASDTGGQRFTVRSNGGIANYSANNVNLSDRREKTNFAPAKSYLDVICAIPVQTYNYIDQDLENDPGLTLGVVAQDVQEVAPELVTESNWGSEEEPKMRLSIYQTDLQYALMKCIQEQQAIIQAQAADIAALKAKVGI